MQHKTTLYTALNFVLLSRTILSLSKQCGTMDSALNSCPVGKGSNPYRSIRNNLWPVVNLTLPRHRYGISCELNTKFKLTFFSSLSFCIQCVALLHGLDVPKQITLSDHCLGFKLVHDFHNRMRLLPSTPISSLGELFCSLVPQ